MVVSPVNLLDQPHKTLLATGSITTYAASLTHLDGFAFLDSRRGGRHCAYDIIAAQPRAVLRLADYDRHLTAWMAAVESRLTAGATGGNSLLAVGFLDYDSAAHGHGVTQRSTPRAAVGLYDWCIVCDKASQRLWFIGSDRVPQLPDDVAELIASARPQQGTFALDSAFQAHISHGDYVAAVATIRSYIAAGDCYQVNFAQRFSAGFSGDSFSAYLRLRDVAPGDFSAFLRLSSDHAILSLSPERFLSTRDGQVTTQPIKGTRPRHSDPIVDRRIAEELQQSAKDRAENIMITDLLRNDLGRLCLPGSVKTPDICVLHSYANVHHLVSRIEGVLRDDVTPGELLIGCSPGGSITGAPKHRAMQIIAELENEPRGIYCGSVFALDGRGWMESSIAIRTMEITANVITCWGGGGIVYDSEADAEYQETLDKVGAFMRALEPSD